MLNVFLILIMLNKGLIFYSGQGERDVVLLRHQIGALKANGQRVRFDRSSLASFGRSFQLALSNYQ